MKKTSKKQSPQTHSTRLSLVLGFICAGAAVAYLAPMRLWEGVSVPVPLPVESTLPEAHGLSASYLSGRYAANVGDFTNASLYLAHALQLDPANAEMVGYAYRMRLISGEMEEAAQMARRQYNAGERESNPEIMALLSYVKEGDIAKARKVLDVFDRAGFNLLVVPLLYGWLDYAEGTLAEPLRIGEAFQNAQDFLPFIAYQMALINDAAGFSEVAQKQYELALNIQKSMPLRVVEMLANLYAREGKWEDLALLQERYRKVSQGKADALPIVFPGKNEKPARLVTNAAQGMAEILFSTAGILNTEHLDEEALIYVQQALYLNPGFLAAQLMRASLLEDMEHYDEAIAAYDALPETSLYYKGAQLRKAYVLSAVHQEGQALKILEKLARESGMRYQAELASGDIFMRDKRYKEAEKAYNTALGMVEKPEKQHWSVFYARGISRERAGKWATAEEDFVQALALHPDQPDVLNYLGYSWLIQGQNLEKARNMIETAIAARPTDAHIIDSMGWALYMLGDYKGAADYLERAIELMPMDPMVNDHLGDVYWRMGRKIEARFQWKRALQFKPEDANQEKQLTDKLEKGLPEISSPKSAQNTGRKDQRVELR